MTASRPLVCRRCGFTNVPGDQFCGSCGAFLEWEGEQVVPDVPAVHPDVPVVGGVAGAGGGAPTPGPVTEPVPTAGAGDLLRCPACGIANAPSRTFCQSCGSRLLEAGRVTSVSQEQIEAAVNAPVTVTTTTIRSTRPQPAESGGGGVLRWILLMAVLGVVVGVGAVVISNLLKGEGPGTAATSAPGTPTTGEATPAPTETASGTEAPTEAPTPTPGPKAERLALLGASASSVVGDLDKFQPTKAIDGDPATAWQEGSETEKGEWIEVVFAPSKVTAVIITNGYNASKALYKGNRRLKDIEIRVGEAAPVTVRLKDTSEPQKIDVKNVSGAVVVRITIVSTYPAVETSVEGTPFDDTALDEIVVMGIPGS